MPGSQLPSRSTLMTQTNEVMRQLSNNEVASVSKMISDTIGKPSYADNVQNALNALTSKKIATATKLSTTVSVRVCGKSFIIALLRTLASSIFDSTTKCRTMAGSWQISISRPKPTSCFPKTSSTRQISMQTPPRVPRLPPIVQHTATVTHRPTVGWAATLARSG